jgi:pimeloyl-[acyl-carrier protein] methyl ester esterase
VPDDNKKVSCVFVHGWGMSRTIWQPVLEKLPDWIEAHALDLPGHGQRTEESFGDLNSIALDLQYECEKIKKPGQPLVLVGWSLGGLACLQLGINQSITVDQIVMVSSTPCFVGRENWDYGIDSEVFKQFSLALKKDFSGTIRRFLALQVKGSESGRLILRDLRKKILQQPQPNEKSLDAGLSVLQQVDLREQLQKIKQPMCWVLGGQDGLVKAELADVLSNVMVFEKAGHAPFLSHTDAFVQQLVNVSAGAPSGANGQ